MGENNSGEKEYEDGESDDEIQEEEFEDKEEVKPVFDEKRVLPELRGRAKDYGTSGEVKTPEQIEAEKRLNSKDFINRPLPPIRPTYVNEDGKIKAVNDPTKSNPSRGNGKIVTGLVEAHKELIENQKTKQVGKVWTSEDGRVIHKVNDKAGVVKNNPLRRYVAEAYGAGDEDLFSIRVVVNKQEYLQLIWCLKHYKMKFFEPKYREDNDVSIKSFSRSSFAYEALMEKIGRTFALYQKTQDLMEKANKEVELDFAQDLIPEEVKKIMPGDVKVKKEKKGHMFI